MRDAVTTLSIVVPVYNERLTLPRVMDQLAAVELPVGREIVVVDDGSTDGTGELVRSFADRPGVRVIVQPTNRGKGAAIRAGLAMCTGDLVLIQDADLEYDPADIPRLLEPILRDRADVVLGSRFVGASSHRVLYFWHSVANRGLTLLSNMLTDLNLTDMEAGYKLFRKDVLDRISLREDRFGFEPEVVAKVARLRLPGPRGPRRVRVYEVGIAYAGRTYEEGKKIGWRDGVRALWCIVRYGRG